MEGYPPTPLMDLATGAQRIPPYPQTWKCSHTYPQSCPPVRRSVPRGAAHLARLGSSCSTAHPVAGGACRRQLLLY